MKELKLMIAAFMILGLAFQNCSNATFGQAAESELQKTALAIEPGAEEEQEPDDQHSEPLPARVDQERARALYESCKKLEARAAGLTKISSGTVLSELTGFYDFHIDRGLIAARRIGGVVNLLATEPSARIGEVSEIGGVLVVCWASVDRIERVGGQVVVVGGDVGAIERFAGRLTVINGKVGTVTQSPGAVIEEIQL